MRTIREFEERVHRHFALGEIPGFVHLYAGQEAIAAGVCAELRTDDYIASTHRGHGHAIAKGCDVKLMMAELFSRRTGLCKGKGGSMHIADLNVGMLGANGVVGGGIPLACGVGLSAKVRGTDQVGVAFLGDGATNEGTFSETLNLAAVWKAPCLFVIENNGYAESTATEFAVAGGEPYKRAAGYGIPGVKVDGLDSCRPRRRGGRSRAGSGGRGADADRVQDRALLRPLRGRHPDLPGRERGRAPAPGARPAGEVPSRDRGLRRGQRR